MSRVFPAERAGSQSVRGPQEPDKRDALPPRAGRGAIWDTLHAEWTKLRTSPGTGWLLLGAAVLTVAVSAGVCAAEKCQTPVTTCGQDTAKLGLTGIMAGQAVVAVLAVLAVSGEYSTGMIRTTLTAVPRRLTMLAAKAAVVGAVVLVTGTIAVLGSLLAGRLILPGSGFTAASGFPPLSLGDAAVLRAAAGSVLYLVLIALLALGATTAVRDSAAGIAMVLGLLYIFPLLTQLTSDPSWHRRYERIGPTTAGLAIQSTRNLRNLPISPWGGLGVLAAWAAAALLAGALALRLRDA